jgi:glycosyltransferase involved in cell wall biosynthesis
MSAGAAQPGSLDSRYRARGNCGPKYHNDFYREGYFQLLQKLVDQGTITDLKVYFESNVEPGIAHWVKGDGVHCEVVPEIRFIDQHIKEDTVIWARGGFKHWHDWLTKYKDKNWLMLYAANTGRERWTWWDVVLDDIGMSNTVDDYGRYLFPFIKPIDDEFYQYKDIPPRFDLCIGASHIHDRKGQWRGIKVMRELKDVFQENVSAVMPGAPRRSERTLEMLQSIHDVDVVLPGHVHKKDLAVLFNESKLALFLGAHGQNDRGPLESAACGTPLILGSPSYHTKLLDDYLISTKVPDLDDYNGIASMVRKILNIYEYPDALKRAKQSVSQTFRERLGMEHSVDRFAFLLDFMGNTKPALITKKCLRDEVERRFL